jgi:DNA-binding LacI/PurR family transcriptional regulator
METRGLSVPEDYIHSADFLAGRGEEAALALLSRPDRPTAIFAGNDNMAVGAYRAARHLGLRIPDDLSVIGFDDMDFAQVLDPPLSTVHQPIEEMAKTAVELLVALCASLAHPLSSRILPTSLVARGSVATPRLQGGTFS